MMMKCRDVTAAASDFLERRLNIRNRMEVLLHLMMCKGCRAYIRQIRLAIEGLHSVGDVQPSGPPPSAGLLEEFRKATRRDPR